MRAPTAAAWGTRDLQGGFWVGTPTMRSDGTPQDSNGRRSPLLKAAVAGLAALCAAALAVGAAGGSPPRSVPGPPAGLAVAGGGRAPAALPPVPRLCFHGPRGEPVDFPAVLDCP